MATIEKGADVLTLINVFTVKGDNQQKLVDLLIEATEKTMKKQPGFVSASIHRSLDGTKVVNYAQWRSKKGPIVCEVADSVSADTPGSRKQ